MHTHAHANLRMVFERPGNFHCAMHRFLRALEKYQRHAVTTRNADHFSAAFSKLRRLAHDVVELLQHFALLVHEQLRITDHVYEQDMRSFQMNCSFPASSHSAIVYAQTPLIHSFNASYMKAGGKVMKLFRAAFELARGHNLLYQGFKSR